MSGRAEPALPDGVELVRDVAYGRVGQRALTLHLLRPRAAVGPRPALVWIHGGAWRQGDKEGGIGRLAPFVARGYVGASVGYRLSGEARFPAQIQDCKCAIRFLRAEAVRLGIDPGRIGVWGASAGGHLAALLGTSAGVPELEGDGGWSEHGSRVQAVCDWYGPTDFRRMDAAGSDIVHDAPDSPESELIGGPIQANPGLAARANPITYVRGFAPPFLIVHGDGDRLVPPNQSELLHEALRRAGVESTLRVLSGAGHGGPAFESAEVARLVADFFDRHLAER